MELRDIEIFLVLAEELHFGRTAQRLHISQARVSQAIKKQERRIGAELFARTSRTVRLTEVGRQFRDDLQPVYAGLHESLERAQRAARGITAQLRVSLMPFNVADLHPYWKAFRARHPQWGLQIRQATFTDPFGQLRSGATDVMIVWLPVEEPDFTVGPTLCTDPRVLAVAADHRLAERDSVPLELLAEFPHATALGLPDYWEDSYLPFHTPRGRRIERITSAASDNADQPRRHGRHHPHLPRPCHQTLGHAEHPIPPRPRDGHPDLRPGLADRSRERPHPCPGRHRARPGCIPLLTHPADSTTSQAPRPRGSFTRLAISLPRASP
ncbi:LysR family transcriptional regulator [Streptomyces sp. NPDC001552]|uniref:LysR family transcriptional regulator n=1 Tax=Streptomyces sp. NPDC001552 TaxID=3364587 RepID=UPI0036A8AEF8